MQARKSLIALSFFLSFLMKNLILDFFFFGHESRFPLTACSNNMKLSSSASLETIIILPVSVSVFILTEVSRTREHSLLDYVKVTH